MTRALLLAQAPSAADGNQSQGSGSELWSVFLQHPIALLVAAAAVAAAAFLAARFVFEREISTLKTQRDGYKEERDSLKNDVTRLQSEVERLRTAAPIPVIPAPEPPPASFREAKNEYLKSRTRQLAETLRELQEQYSAYEHRFMPGDVTEEERQRLWEEGIRRDEMRRAGIARQYSQIRGEVIALKQELLRRVHPSVATGRNRHVDVMYEMQAGPSPFHEIADDLEMMALNLS